MGFEPTTFCMASSTWGRSAWAVNYLQTSGVLVHLCHQRGPRVHSS